MSNLFRLNASDFAKGAVVAVLSGVFLPIQAIIQSPGFNISTADWHAIGLLALNGAITGFIAYLAKNFLSDENGKVMGRIG